MAIGSATVAVVIDETWVREHAAEWLAEHDRQVIAAQVETIVKAHSEATLAAVVAAGINGGAAALESVAEGIGNSLIGAERLRSLAEQMRLVN